VSGSSAGTVGSAAWSSFLHDAQNSLSSDLAGPSSSPKVNWRMNATKNSFINAAIGSDGTIYTVDDTTLTAWDAKGTKLWAFVEETYLSHVVLIQEKNLLYVTAQRSLYLINSTNGKSVKNITLEDSSYRISPFSLVVDSSENAYFAVLSDDSSEPSAIYGVNPNAQGDPIVWKTEVNIADASFDEHLAITADDKVLVASALNCDRQNCEIYAQGYDTSSGDLIWQSSFPVSYHFAVSPTVGQDGIVYFTASSTYAVNATTGNFLWIYNSDGSAFSATAGGFLYTHSFYRGDVSIIDNTGKNVKNITIDGVKITDLVVSTASNALFVSGISGNDTVVAYIDLKTYNQNWQVSIPNTSGGLIAIAPSNTLLLFGPEVISLA
jgi:hypothetical protein